MTQKHKILFFIIGICVALVFCGFAYTNLPHSIVKDVETCHVMAINYNPVFGQKPKNKTFGDTVALTGYDEDAVLFCLSHYKQQFTKQRMSNWSVRDVAITIVLDMNGDKDGGWEVLYLGTENFVSIGEKDWKYQIIDGDKLCKELWEILDLFNIA